MFNRPLFQLSQLAQVTHQAAQAVHLVAYILQAVILVWTACWGRVQVGQGHLNAGQGVLDLVIQAAHEAPPRLLLGLLRLFQNL